MLRAIEENKRIRALVIDIDSPGGGAGGVGVQLYRSIGRDREARSPSWPSCAAWERPAATWLACGATKIVAVPMAIVGSIGVISMRPMLYEMLEKIGVRMEVTKAGRLKDMFSQLPRADGRGAGARSRRCSTAFYERFVELVSEAREHAPGPRTRELATGEIFTAEQAKDNGLIDELGDLDTAIDLAQALAGCRNGR